MFQGKKVKRVMTLILSVILMLALVTSMSGCGASNQKSSEISATTQAASTTQATTAQPTPDTTKPFTLWVAKAGTSTDENLIQQEWAKMGINVKVQWTQGDVMAALNLKMNSGGFEDAALFNNIETYKSAFIKSGMIMPVEDLLKKPEYPSLGKIPQKVLDRVKSSDGHIWMIPTWFDQNPDDPWPGWASHSLWIRTDLLEQAGMTEADLATVEGVEKYLRETAKLKTADGKPVIPLGYYEAGAVSILSAFGVNTGVASGAAAAVKKVGDQFVFAVDDPGYKQAYKWMSKLYREKLLDKEVITQKEELFKEKMTQGIYAMSSGIMNAKLWEVLDGPTAPSWFLKPIPNFKVEGVTEPGTVAFVDPYSAFGVFISKNTKNLDSILNFLNYSLEPNPIRQQEMTEGPVGVYWNWVDQPLGLWKFEDKYGEERYSGDAARVAKLSPMLWQAASYAKEWYPWWTVAPAPNVTKGFPKTNEFNKLIGTYGTKKAIHHYDIVPAIKGGVWEKYGLTMQTVQKEYEAKLLMAKSDEEFEKVWETYMKQLEQRAHWSEMKAEWLQSYQETAKNVGQF